MLLELVMLMNSMCAMPAGDVSQIDCGAHCLYLSLSALEVDNITLESVRAELGSPSDQGYSLGNLAEVAKRHGLQARAVKTTLANLESRRGRFACIAMIAPAHFINVVNMTPELVEFADAPSRGSLEWATFESRWDGTALLLSRDEIDADTSELGIRRWLLLGLLAASLASVVVFRRRGAAKRPV